MSQASQVETPKRLTETLTETPKRLIGLPPDHDETSAPKVADEFDWGDPGGLMCEEQQAVVAYRNDNRDLVLRQKANWPHDQDDAVIIIAKGNIETFVDRLTDLLGFVGPA
jgi:hypothetical protein